MNMKIIHLTSVHGRYDVRIFTKECVSLAKAGYTVYLIVADGKGDEILNGVSIIDAGAHTGNRLARMTKTVKRIYEKAVELKGDFYHFHDPELFPIGLRLKKNGKKVIFDSHEDYTEDILNKTWIPLLIRKVISVLYNLYERRAVKKLDGVITATSTIRKRFDKYRIDTIEINNYPIIAKSEECNQIKREKHTVAYIGAIGDIRGMSEMIKAMEHVESTLIIAGTFTTEKEYKKAISLKGWEKVDYRGQVDKSEIKPILQKSSAGLVLFHPGPNHDNSQPNKLFEYMAEGLPVIASNFKLWQEIIEKNNCGICVDPLQPVKIAEAIKEIYNNPDKAEIMGKNGIKAVENKYNWYLESKKLINFYAELKQ